MVESFGNLSVNNETMAFGLIEVGGKVVLEVERRSCDAGQRCVTHRVHELHVPGPCMGCVRRCFELAVHVNIVAVFRKVTGAEQQKGSAVAAKYAQ